MGDSNLDERDYAPDTPAPDGCCCWPLWNGLRAAGRRGLAIVLGDEPDGFRFWLQSRGVDDADERTLGGSPRLPRDLCLNIVTSQAIRYCPWCGSRLDDVAASAPEAFARFAAAHRTFAPPTL